MSERRLLVKVEAERYRKARKKEKGRILDDLIALSGYHRWYAVGLLRGQGKVTRSRCVERCLNSWSIITRNATIRGLAID